MKHGVIRNGEHVELHSTKEEAKEHVELLKSRDQIFARDGWICQESADSVHYRIVEVKRKPW